MVVRILQLGLLVCVGLGGWIIGSVYPVPASVIVQISPGTLQQQARAAVGTLHWEQFEQLLSPEQKKAIENSAMSKAVASGQAIAVEAAGPEAIAAEQPYSVARTAHSNAPDGFGSAQLAICPDMAITNSPPVNAKGNVASYKPFILVNGVRIALYPTEGACLASGFGDRHGKLHKGVDFYAPEGGPIFAAGNGKIIEIKYRDDYGNMILIDHGAGVYTRYGHLASFQKGMAVGTAVKAGQQIGLMGNTAGYKVPIHLHFEILLGNYNNPEGSFGLAAEDPFRFPSAG